MTGIIFLLVALPLVAAPLARFAEHTIATGLTGGYQVVVADLNHDGRPDVIVANKKGIFVHLSQPASK